MKKFPIIKKSPLRLAIGALCVAAARVLFLINFRPSIEFTGGILLDIPQVSDSQQLKSEIQNFYDQQESVDATVLTQNREDLTQIIAQIRFTNDVEATQRKQELSQFLLAQNIISDSDDIVSISSISPSISDFMQSAAIRAVIIGVIFMVIYMLFSFAAIRKNISPNILGVVTVATMIFDISIPAGLYGVLMAFDSSAAVDSVFVIAILTTIGYSINDTIIIFDRVRENMIAHATDKKTDKKTDKTTLAKIFETSLRQTMRRSIGTSATTLIVVILMFILGTGAMQYFAFTMSVGIIAGSFSSIFIAAPMAYLALGKQKSQQKSQKN